MGFFFAAGHAAPSGDDFAVVAAALIYQHATRERDKAIADAVGKLADTAKAGPE